MKDEEKVVVKQKRIPSGMRYIGKGAHLDVPRRDLTQIEVEKFGREWLLSLHCPNTGGPLYEEVILDGE